MSGKARNSRCNKCLKVGHWAKICRTKVVAELVKENSDNDANYESLGYVPKQCSVKSEFKIGCTRSSIQVGHWS